MITIIDSGICNIASVLRALRQIGASCSVTTDAARVAEANAILLPGVGAFADGMRALRNYGLIEPIQSHARLGKPILGICLGMQLLADCSEEFGDHNGLGLISGRINRLPTRVGLRVPNIGWCDVKIDNNNILFTGVEDNTSFYFVHSYAMKCDDENNSAGSIDFGNHEVTVACQSGSVFGVQFHPEKSQDAGLVVLDNFVKRFGS